ncbi:hypothetical protein A5761_15355 [Mycolicibacterium setense]|uniref:hypothetical protein n=1 Tax=Mycolicibacterium setense TaxID=431269 RepID=UPI0007E92CE4|nr:hypothetical protein [Mycolicibacterium setense]OBB14697.1 hypothetical protein A5761_15355 [Mycolicibacterium setense]
MSTDGHTAAAYEVMLAPIRKPKETLPLDNFDGDGGDFLRFFASFVNSMPKGCLVRDGSKSYGDPAEVLMAGCTYSCRLVSGTAGISSDFRQRGDNPAYRRTPEDFEEMTFGVYLLRPPNAKVGFLIIERIGDRTITQVFRTKLVEHFRAMYPGVMLSLSRTAHTDAWHEAEAQGESLAVKTLTIVHRSPGQGQMSQFGIGGLTKKVGEYRRVLKFTDEPESAGFLAKARNYFMGPPAVSATGGLTSTTGEDDGGADEDEHDAANELIAEIRYPGQGIQSIRCSGARPQAIKYDISVTPGGENAHNEYVTAAKALARSLAAAGSCVLESGWDTGAWEDASALPKWEVEGFDQTTAASEQPSE